ncbi:MAG TPA: glutamate synthase subunit beta [Candidatus Fournierella excrementigallinarum]|nr:glutamate synthase subunit beta [Candidatus Fournierella excrementigallinarum]
MGKTTGFLEYPRQEGPVVPPLERLGNFREFHRPLSPAAQALQAARCMDCGVPFCQAGVALAGMTAGCPLHNLVPEMNDLVFHGNWEQAWRRLERTNCLPEFTGRVCPALCEAACTCARQEGAVCTHENELQVAEYAFSHGLVNAAPPAVRTGKTVAVVGSGPAGLAAAWQLNRRGHSVTVFEKADRPGGLLRYGIPNMKLDKAVLDRRIRLMEEAGVTFVCNTDVGRDAAGEELLAAFDRVVLAGGAGRPRDLAVPGREAKGILFAVDFLGQVTKALLDSNFQKPPRKLAEGKNVLVVGGGDTGNDCVATALRLGAKSVTQLEMMPQPPLERTADNPWPQWPKVRKTDYGQQEAIALFGADPRRYQATVSAFKADKRGRVCGAVVQKLEARLGENGRTVMAPAMGGEEVLPAELALIAAGFVGCEEYLPASFGAALTGRGVVAAEGEGYATSAPRVFAAGDMRRGPSLVVWAIAEGMGAARAADASLMGYSNL